MRYFELSEFDALCFVAIYLTGGKVDSCTQPICALLWTRLCLISFQPKILYVWLVIIMHLPQAHQYLFTSCGHSNWTINDLVEVLCLMSHVLLRAKLRGKNEWWFTLVTRIAYISPPPLSEPPMPQSSSFMYLLHLPLLHFIYVPLLYLDFCCFCFLEELLSKKCMTISKKWFVSTVWF